MKNSLTISKIENSYQNVYAVRSTNERSFTYIIVERTVNDLNAENDYDYNWMTIGGRVFGYNVYDFGVAGVFDERFEKVEAALSNLILKELIEKASL